MLRLLTKPDIENEAPLIRQAAKKRLQRNPHLKTQRTELTIIWQHNHNIRTAEALRWNRISDETKRLMVEDLADCCNVPLARKQFDERLEKQMKTAADTLILRADRSHCPTLTDWYYLASTMRQQNHGDQGLFRFVIRFAKQMTTAARSMTMLTNWLANSFLRPNLRRKQIGILPGGQRRRHVHLTGSRQAQPRGRPSANRLLLQGQRGPKPKPRISWK